MMGQDETADGTATSSRLTGVEPILAVRDVPSTVDYYRDVLGFEDVWMWGDPPTHGGANRDGVQIQFSQSQDLAETAEGRSLYVAVRHVEAIYAQHRGRGAEIVSALEPKPWGVSEYTVRDLNGYRLRFAGQGGARHCTPERPTGITIESRVPTWPETEALIHAVGWTDATDFETAPRALAASICGAVAIVGGRVVGCVTVTADGAGYYQVRDLMVHPDLQGRRIGSALMETLLSDLRIRVPGPALVGLYTGANLHEFYSRFGFRGPDHGPYGMTLAIEGRGRGAGY